MSKWSHYVETPKRKENEEEALSKDTASLDDSLDEFWNSLGLGGSQSAATCKEFKVPLCGDFGPNSCGKEENLNNILPPKEDDSDESFSDDSSSSEDPEPEKEEQYRKRFF